MSNMSLDEFLGHKSSSREGGGRVLNWKKRKPPVLNGWLHTKASIVALWRHGWPRLVEFERDGTKQKEVWSGFFNCHEPEDTLRRQYRRTAEGARVAPPKACPMCLLLEHLRTEVQAGRLSWTEPVFRFEGDDDRQTTTLTAGGMYGAFNGDLTREEVADLRRAGIRRDEAWKQQCNAKCAYVFSLVDNDETDKGAQVCVETTALGDAVKQVIRDQMDALGETEGHPLRSPYAIRWEYHPDEQEFSKKYRALAMPKIALSPQVRALITDTAPPDISSMIEPGNALALRAVMETHALIDLPFDRLFAAAEQPARAEQAPAPRQAQRNGAARPGARPADEDEREPLRTRSLDRDEAARERAQREEPPAAPARARRRAVQPEPEERRTMPDYPDGTVIIPCDSCGAKMADTDEECWKCGAKYAVEPNPAPARPGPAKTQAAGKSPVKATPPLADDDDMPW